MPVVRPDDLAYRELPGRLAADPFAAAPLAGVETGSTVRVVRVMPGPRIPHLHPYCEEILYILSGSGTTWEGDASTVVGPGDVVVVPTGIPHATVAHGPEDLVVVCFFPHPDLAANTEELEGPERMADAH
jgi:quercetin dioxygenase-like cupin family protein